MKIKENYAAIERTVALVKEKFGADSKIAVMFEKCISNTLQTTIKIKENDTVFVITGDIPAMWLRDSACQLRPFLLFAKEEPELVDIFCGQCLDCAGTVLLYLESDKGNFRCGASL